MRMIRELQRGFISLEVMATLIVVIAGMVISTQWVANDVEQRSNQVAAEHAKVFSDATVSYIKANYSTVAAAAVPLVTYTASTISAYLPASFTTTNNYGQSYSIRVYKNGSILETMIVTTGGETISEASVRRIASMIGASGGYVSAANTAVAQGTQGGWSMAFANYGGTPGAGKLAVALFFQDGQQVSDYLYRSAVAGHPELNRMNTALDMNGNDVNNVNSIAASRIGANGLSPTSGYPGGWGGGVHAYDMYGEGTIGVGAAGSLTAYMTNNGTVGAVTVSATNVSASNDVTAQNWLRTNGNSGWYSNAWGGGWYMQDSTWVRSYADKNIYTGGTMMAGAIRSNGRMTADEYIQLSGAATSGAGCSPNGLLAQDGSGGLLMCKSGVWTSSGGSVKVASQHCKGGTVSGSSVTLNSCSLCLPSSGTYQIMATAYAHQAAWYTGILYINGTTVDSNLNHGDQQGTGYGVVSGVLQLSGSGCVPLSAYFNGMDTTTVDITLSAIAVGY